MLAMICYQGFILVADSEGNLGWGMIGRIPNPAPAQPEYLSIIPIPYQSLI